MVGIDAARAATNLVHDDVPGNIGARMEQENGDARAAIAAAPHTLTLDLTVERSACMPMEGRGTVARWDPDSAACQVWTSTQTSTGVRAAVAAKLGLDLGQVDVITPDVGGGFGVKINHPWPEELLVPLAAQTLGRPVKFTEDRREHFISSAHERGQVQHIEVGFDDEGRLLGLDVMFWHDHGAYTPYGLIVPIITSTQLLGPYKPANYRVVFESLYTNTVMVTPYRGAGRPQGCYAMERTMDAIAAYLGKDRTEVRAVNFIQPDEFPYDARAGVPGRAAADLRLGRLPGVAGEDQGAGRLGRVRDVPRRDGGRGTHASASAWPATSRAPASAPTRARTCTSRPPARSRSRPASPPRARATRPRSRRSSPTSSACASRTSRWSPATPAGCRTPWARSPPAPR